MDDSWCTRSRGNLRGAGKPGEKIPVQEGAAKFLQRVNGMNGPLERRSNRLRDDVRGGQSSELRRFRRGLIPEEFEELDQLVSQFFANRDNLFQGERQE